MARKNYSEEFRRQAVDLYESTPGATVRGIAADLGIVRGTLRHWLEVYGTGKKTAPDGTRPRAPAVKGATGSPARPETPEQELARLEARVSELEARDHQAHHRAGDPPAGGQVFRRGDALVSRFQFVADHSATFEVKRLCELVEVSARPTTPGLGRPCPRGRAAGPTRSWPSVSGPSTTRTTPGAPRITAELNDGTGR